MNLSIADQLRNLGFAKRIFEPPGEYLKRRLRERHIKSKELSEIYGPVPAGTHRDMQRAAEARYLRFVRQPHASSQWGEMRITAGGI